MPRLVKASSEAFETLVATIISQNTADANTERAYQKLQGTLKITPKALAEAPKSQIENAIKVAGLWQAKAEAIQAASKTILNRYGGSLDAVVGLPVEEARRALMAMQGVGPKTADVVLLFSAGKPTIPVDTHVNRVSRRLGLAPQTGGYEVVRLSLQAHFEAKDYLSVHLLLIGLGRQFCRAQKPLHCECPVRCYCPSNTCGGAKP
ncbi:MAG: endonuclease III [Candidatus Bathyarchaeota archaeon]|nr:endonuclease III [Candidatus Bathyarchaeota archaeon]